MSISRKGKIDDDEQEKKTHEDREIKTNIRRRREVEQRRENERESERKHKSYESLWVHTFGASIQFAFNVYSSLFSLQQLCFRAATCSKAFAKVKQKQKQTPMKQLTVYGAPMYYYDCIASVLLLYHVLAFVLFGDFLLHCQFVAVNCGIVVTFKWLLSFLFKRNFFFQ